MLFRPQRLVLVGLSARMMAQSVCRGGWRPVVLDLFGDRDTREVAHRCHTIGSRGSGFDEASLLSTARSLVPAAGATGLIYGSGFDACPDLLAALAKRFVLFGNEPETVRLLKQPKRFFELLQRLDIPYPASCFGSVGQRHDWLVKSAFSEGGKGVRYSDQRRPLGTGEFVQRRLPGAVMSALFLADGGKARIIGFNTQWSTAHNLDRPFLFSGVVAAAELNRGQRRQVAEYVSRLVAATGLKGLNSLDFMRDGDQCQVLEINPRPSASMGLYDEAFPAGLMAEHLWACQGVLGDCTPRQTTIRAYRIIYAVADFIVPTVFTWPEWSHDRPFGGAKVAAGNPLCSVTAAGSTTKQAMQLLQLREKALIDQLFDFRCSA